MIFTYEQRNVIFKARPQPEARPWQTLHEVSAHKLFLICILCKGLGNNQHLWQGKFK